VTAASAREALLPSAAAKPWSETVADLNRDEGPSERLLWPGLVGVVSVASSWAPCAPTVPRVEGGWEAACGGGAGDGDAVEEHVAASLVSGVPVPTDAEEAAALVRNADA